MLVNLRDLKNKTFLCQCDVMGGFSVLVIEEF
jgi:hypothetical protein